MCGVVGFNGKFTRPAFSLFCRLVDQSEARGMHAYGIATASEDCAVNTFKGFTADYIKEIAQTLVGKKGAVIAHTRYSTSGDYKVHANNQPIVRGNTALVFNGVVTQLPKHRWVDSFGVECQTENDGEILLALAEAGQPIGESIDATHATFAGLWLADGNIYAYRNHRRPLYSAKHTSGTFYASTSDIFKRAWPDSKPVACQPGVTYATKY